MPVRILLLTPEFYGIENEIKSALELSGFEVFWFENKTLPLDYHGTKAKFKFLRRIYFFLFFPHIRYIKKELGKIDKDIVKIAEVDATVDPMLLDHPNLDD